MLRHAWDPQCDPSTWYRPHSKSSKSGCCWSQPRCRWIRFVRHIAQFFQLCSCYRTSHPVISSWKSSRWTVEPKHLHRWPYRGHQRPLREPKPSCSSGVLQPGEIVLNDKFVAGGKNRVVCLQRFFAFEEVFGKQKRLESHSSNAKNSGHRNSQVG